MNFKTTIALLIVLIALFCASWFLGVFSPQSQKSHKAPVIEAKKSLLIAPKLKGPKRIKLEIRGRGYLVFENNKGKWTIVEPIKAPAVSWEVTELISTFGDAKKLETFVPGQGDYADTTLADTGLDDPLMKVSITDKDGRVIKLLVGRNVIASEDTYVKLAGSKEVFIVDQNIRKRIKRDLQAYRDKQLWEINKDKITELDYVHNGKEQFKFVKGKKGEWLMLAPVRAKADKEKIKDALDKLSDLSAEEFVEDTFEGKLSPYGLEKPVWKITIIKTEEIKPKKKSKDKNKGKNDKKKTSTQPTSKPVIKKTKYVLLIGVKSGLGKQQVYAKRADRKWVFTLKEDDVNKFLPDSVKWRDKKIVDIAKSDLSKIEITGQGEKVVLEKKNASWRVKWEGKFVSCDTNAVDELIDSLVSMTSAGFVDNVNNKFLRQAGLIRSEYTVKLSLTNKLEPIVLNIGKTSPSGLYRYIHRNGIEYVCAVDIDNLKKILRPVLVYLDKQMLKFDLDDVTEIKLTRKDRTYHLKRTKGKNNWQIISPIKASADKEKVKNILLSCATLQAEEYVSHGRLSRYHLARPNIKLTIITTKTVPVIQATKPASTQKAKQKQKIKYKTVKETISLIVSRYKASVYAALAGKSNAMVAKVSSSLFDDLSAELIPTKIFADIDKDKIDRLDIIRRNKSLTFVRKGDSWSYPADPIFKVDKGKLEKIITAMSELKARRYVDFSKKHINKYGLHRPYLKVVLKAGKKQYWLAIGTNSPAGRFAISSSKDWIFEISVSDANKFDKTLKDLAK